jgi:hypothetical protein
MLSFAAGLESLMEGCATMDLLTPLSICSVLDGDTLRQLNIGIKSDTDFGEVRHEMSVPRSDYNGVCVRGGGSSGTVLMSSRNIISYPSYLFREKRLGKKVNPMIY